MIEASRRHRLLLLVPALLVLAVVASGCVAADGTTTLPSAGIGQPSGATTPAAGVQLLVLMTVLSLAPALLVMVTSFTRIVIVLSLVRNAVGVPQLPPNQVLVGIAFLLTVFVMAPVWKTVNEHALKPYVAGSMSQGDAVRTAEVPVRGFMLAQTRKSDLVLFTAASGEKPAPREKVPMTALVPAFVLSELKTAFIIGFVIFIPFLIIGLIVSSTLMSMGMFMLPPVLVSLPFKLLLFVMVDGWALIVRSLITSFHH
jgi:flagellar biosynthetic protein FliP